MCCISAALGSKYALDELVGDLVERIARLTGDAERAAFGRHPVYHT